MQKHRKYSPFISTSYIPLIPQIWDHILASRDTSSLNGFLIIAFADLKKYKYYYWFAFPAFAAKPAWEIDDPHGWKSATDTFTTEQVRMTKSLMDTPHLTQFSSP
jgi:ubiquitin-like modifier-activating enzyme ATG7